MPCLDLPFLFNCSDELPYNEIVEYLRCGSQVHQLARYQEVSTMLIIGLGLVVSMHPWIFEA